MWEAFFFIYTFVSSVSYFRPYTCDMRKPLFFLLLILAAGSAPAQQKPFKIGIKAGLNYIHLENYGKGYYSDFDAKAGWSAGALFQYTKGGFLNYSIVPELQFTSTTTDVDLIYLTDCITTIQSVDLPVNFKLGLQLSKIFRPYILANVYGSYIVAYEGDIFYMLDDMDEDFVKKDINRFYFGVSAGAGFDLWKFQIEGRYRWNLNRISSEDYSELKQMGLELTCAFLF